MLSITKAFTMYLWQNCKWGNHEMLPSVQSILILLLEGQNRSCLGDLVLSNQSLYAEGDESESAANVKVSPGLEPSAAQLITPYATAPSSDLVKCLTG